MCKGVYVYLVLEVLPPTYRRAWMRMNAVKLRDSGRLFHPLRNRFACHIGAEIRGLTSRTYNHLALRIRLGTWA